MSKQDADASHWTPRLSDDVASARPRILVGQFFHETHGLNPRITTANRFVVERGARLVDKAIGTGTTLAGILSKSSSLGYSIVPSLGFWAQPSGPIDHDFYLRVRNEFFERVRLKDYDAIALDMHGAMCTPLVSDADGDLLSHLREIVGAEMPIGVGLDMHAHVTRAMLRAADICIACKESPHTDFPECGERVVECLAAMLDGQLRPVRVMAKAPMIHLDAGLTASGPLSEIKRKAETLSAAHPDIWDISLYQVYRFSDYDEEKGQTVVILTNDVIEPATEIAEALAREFWDNRERFREDLPNIDEALDRVVVETAKRPFVLGDMGDRVIAGAPGDGNAILRAALHRSDGLRGAIPVTDPVSVAAAIEAGVGAKLTLQIGGRFTPGFSPLAVEGVITALGDGQFEISGAVFEGEKASLGATVLFLVEGRLHILLTSEPGLTHTPSAFTSQGVDIAAMDFVVAKSGMHFRANFEGMATPLLVATPGLSFPTKGFVSWKNQRFWPEQEDFDPMIRAQVFQRGADKS